MATTPEYVPDVPDEDLQSVATHYHNPGSDFLVGELQGKIVAMGAYTTPSDWKEGYMHLDEETAELTRMRVDPAHHRRGFGSALYRELERRALRDGYRRLVLDTGIENDVARTFYEGLGFEFRRTVTLEFEAFSFELVLYEKAIDD